MLERLEFRDWLLAHAPDDVVGTANLAHCCPLAEYVRSATGRPVVVAKDRLYFDRQLQTMPQWAADFVAKVDQRPFAKVTAAEAYALLEETC
jgi:hypothetical protein